MDLLSTSCCRLCVLCSVAAVGGGEELPVSAQMVEEYEQVMVAGIRWQHLGPTPPFESTVGHRLVLLYIRGVRLRTQFLQSNWLRATGSPMLSRLLLSTLKSTIGVHNGLFHSVTRTRVKPVSLCASVCLHHCLQYGKRFWAAVHARTSKNELDLEELEEGSPLEMCYLLGEGQEGIETSLLGASPLHCLAACGLAA